MISFHSFYKIAKGPPAHKSATCIVAFAEFYCTIDAPDDAPDAIETVVSEEVALKFMKEKDQFDRELSIRAGLTRDRSFVIDVMHYHPGGRKFKGDEAKFKLSITESKKGFFKDYPYCVVLPQATRGPNDVITHDHIAGVPDRILDVKAIAHQIAEALAHLHEKNVIHGDLVSERIIIHVC
jgi:serine/threonine protein kinase